MSFLNLIPRVGGTGWTGGFWMPEAASESARNIDTLFFFILGLSSVFFVGIMAAAAYFVIRYRRRSADQKTSATHGSTTLEIVWIVVPTILLFVIFGWSFSRWMDLNVAPGNSMEVRVNGMKWSWNYDYPEAGVSGVTELVVPVNQPVKLIMSSYDVLHSFYIPALRIKRDVVPGRYTVQWFEADTEGTYDVFCAEYCGTSHSRMLSKLRVVPQAEYDAWIEEQAHVGEGTVGKGRKIFAGAGGCTACHSVDGAAGIGPTLQGIFGKEEMFADGSLATVDENYLRESIVEPNAKVVKGFNPVMPTFQGRFKEDELNALVDYIKSLSGVVVEDTSGGSALAEKGKALYSGKGGCLACHSLDGAKGVGPSFQGLFGSEETLQGGAKVTVDEAYLIESIQKPNDKIVDGYGPVMPAMPLSDEEVKALVEFIKSLGAAGATGN